MSEPHRQENFSSLMEFMKWLFGGQSLVRDSLINTQVMLDAVHYEVHEGDFYTYSNAATINAGTATALSMVVRPGVGKQLHFQGIVSSKNSGWAELFENVEYTGGSTISPKNNNRASANTFGGTMIVNPTITDFGTQLQSRAVGSSAPGVRIGGESETRNEWILSDEYWYLIWFYADSATTQVSLDFEAYEVTT